jgi:hypothetical protein
MRFLIPSLAISFFAITSCSNPTKAPEELDPFQAENLKFLEDNIKLHKELLMDNTSLSVTYYQDSLGKLKAFYNPNGFNLMADTNLEEHALACTELDVEDCLLKTVSKGKSVSAKSCAVCFYIE